MTQTKGNGNVSDKKWIDIKVMCCQQIFNICVMFKEIFGPKGFVIKSVLFLFIICVPGNLITIILLYKQWSSIDEITNLKSESNTTGATYKENTLKDNSTSQVS